MRWMVLTLLIAGCSHTAIDARSHPANGEARVKLHFESSALAAILIGGALIAGAAEDLQDPRPFPSLSQAFDMSPPARFALDPNRSVSEQDCSGPIDFTHGNLRCR